MTNSFGLTENNYVEISFGYYRNPVLISEKEVHEDLDRIKFIRRIIKNYFTKSKVNIRLLVNHIIVLNNVFETEYIRELLFFFITDTEDREVLKTILLYVGLIHLDYLPDLKINQDIMEMLNKM